MLRSGLVFAALGSTLAAAAPATRRIAVDTPTEAFAAQGSMSRTIYLERCVGGCRITKGTINDARANSSSIPNGAGPFMISEYTNTAGQAGAAADAEWNEIVACVQEVYSPIDVTVTDVRPTEGTYHAAVIAGVPGDLGMANDILGIAPLAADCAPQDNVMSFTFANAHQPSEHVKNVCWTAAQESAHAFGLDHEFAFKDGSSACNDPMTYRTDCGGQRFFRNAAAVCGEFTEKAACKCGATQNSHHKLVSVFGAGTSLTPPPTSVITLPSGSASTLGAVVAASAGSQRGVSKVELLLNGFPWAEVKGSQFGPVGQANPDSYTILVPTGVPDGIIDIVVRAHEDIGTFTDSAPVTVTKGAPCVGAETCAAHQKCEAGRCLWDPAVGETGDACTYAQLCKSGLCRGPAGAQSCTEPCFVDTDTCPGDLTCVETQFGEGTCQLQAGGGCCSIGAGSGWVPGGSATLVLGLLLRRRRR